MINQNDRYMTSFDEGKNAKVDWLFKLCRQMGVDNIIPPQEAMAFMLELDKFRHIEQLAKKHMKTCNNILEYLRSKVHKPIVYRELPNVFKEEFEIEV